jgi:hypothetical protein
LIPPDRLGEGLKSLMIIIISSIGFVALAAIALLSMHRPVHPIEPLAAAAIGAISGSLGILPLIRSGRRDPVSVLQMAMVGTVLHLLSQIVLAGAVVATHAVNIHGSFLFWLMAEYWVSLIALISQLRKLILSAIPSVKGA